MKNDTGALVISLDFELIWGVRDLGGSVKRKDLLPTRKVVLRLLDLFKKYEIHATWATVGFLFFETRDQMLKSLPDRVPAYQNQQLSPYFSISEEVGVDEVSDPLHFAPSLIRLILDTPYQELGTHTFSHYYCLEDGQTPEDFQSDLQAALRAGERFGCKIESIVFPRNQYSQEYLDICAQNGIKSYRGNEAIWFRTPSKRSDHRRLSRRFMRILDAYFNVSGSNAYKLPIVERPVNIPASRYLRSASKRLKVLEPLRLRRIISSLRQTAKDGHIFHLWWHPEDFSEDMDANFDFLEKILMEFSELRVKYGMRSLTMGEVTKLSLSD